MTSGLTFAIVGLKMLHKRWRNW